MKNILIIPDSHVRPGVGHRRWHWLGKFIKEHKPDVVVDLGDFADMESLSSYDKGKKSFEGRRYRKDVDAAVEAREILSGYIPKGVRRIGLLGNHEHRIDRAVDLAPELDGMLSCSDLQHEALGWEVVPFNEPVNVAGMWFSHYWPSGVMGRPVSGKNHAQRLIDTQHVSTVQGHSHLWAYAEATTPGGKKIQSIVAGCFLDKDQKENYAGQANNMWYKGVTLLQNVEAGYARSFWRISVNDLESMYG